MRLDHQLLAKGTRHAGLSVQAWEPCRPIKVFCPRLITWHPVGPQDLASLCFRLMMVASYM
jgi:hypothetical protein